MTVARDVIRLTAPNPSMMTGPGTNSYVVGDQQLVVIDPGPDDAVHRQRLIDVIAGREVLAIVVTHTHIDHAPGANPLGRIIGAPCLGYGPGERFVPDMKIDEGDVVGEGDGCLRVLHTPGHASNHLCFLIEDQGLLFTGDHVMEGSTVVIRPPDGDLLLYLENLRRLATIQPSLLSIAPGHGRLIDDPGGVLADIEQHRVVRHAVVLASLEEVGSCEPADLVDQVYPGIEDQRRPVAAAMLWAHLEALVTQGSADVERDQLRGEGVAPLFSYRKPS